jgi:glycosyltransferase involved in cell wall biosynthesis
MVTVSIIIPTYNRLAVLRKVLAALEEQSVPPSTFEVIVVSDGSTDGTDQFLAENPSKLNLRAIFQPDLGAAVARNMGVQASTGEIILFLDDDVVPAPELVQEHLRFQQERGSQTVVIGPMLAPVDFHPPIWVQWEHSTLANQYSAMEQGLFQTTARQFYTGNTSLKRKLFLEAGGFDPSFRRAEDVELAYRLAARGAEFLFDPKAVGYHYANRTFSAWISIPYAYGVNDVIFTKEKGQNWLLPTLWKEFNTRHPIIKGLTRLCLGRPWMMKACISALRGGLCLSRIISSRQLGLYLCSVMFNLRYYQGVADRLGGRDRFFAGVVQSVSPAHA